MFLLFFLFVQMFLMAIRLMFLALRLTFWLIVITIRVTPTLFAFTLLLAGWMIKLLVWTVVGIAALTYGTVKLVRARRARITAAPPRPARTPRPASTARTSRPARPPRTAAPNMAFAGAPTATTVPPTTVPPTAAPTASRNDQPAPPSSRREARQGTNSTPTPSRTRPRFHGPKLNLPDAPQTNLDPKGRLAAAPVNHWKAARRGRVIGWIALPFAAAATVLTVVGLAANLDGAGETGVLLFFPGAILGLIALVFAVIGRQTTTPASKAAAQIGVIAGVSSTLGPAALLFVGMIAIGIVRVSTGTA